MNNDNTFLGKEPIGKLLFKLSVPTVAAQIVNMLYNVVDRIFIGHMPDNGGLALAGVGICMPIILLVSAFAALVSSGGAPRASIFMGRGDNKTAERIMGVCFSMQIIVSIVITIIMLAFGRDMLLLFGASPNTIDYAMDYMSIYVFGTVFVQITLGMNAYITAQGFTKIGMRTVLIGALLNIVLDPVFIFEFNMGVKGAALATVISQGVSCLWVIGFLCGKKTILRLKKEQLRIDLNVFWPCAALGLAPFIMQVSESLIAVCFNSSLLRYGDDIAVGAMTILTSVMQFAMLPMQGLAQGAQPITSYNFGAGNKERIIKTFKLLLTVSLIYSTVLWAVVMLLPRTFAGMFTANNELVVFSGRALRVYCAVLLVFGIQVACQMTFVAIGNAMCSIIVAVVRKFVLLIPLIYIMPSIMADKTMAIYTAEPVADLLAVTFTAVLFSVQFKKALNSIDERFNAPE